MGYTHYWRINRKAARELKDHWGDIVKHCAEFCEAQCKEIIQREDDNPKPAVFSKKEIRFNGIGDDGHETFLLRNVASKFEFCKTARKPYDLAVISCLFIAKAFAPSFDVASDGFGFSSYYKKHYAYSEVLDAINALKDFGFLVELKEVDEDTEVHVQRVPSKTVCEQEAQEMSKVLFA